jgi:PEP-CTERM motif
MQRLAAVTGLVLGLAMMPGAVRANPIGTNGCTLGPTGYECDVFVDDVTGHSTLDASALAPSWLVGYTFLLNVAADLSDGIQDTDVAHVVVFHSNFIDVFTPTVGSSAFSGAVANALALVAIDATPLVDGQIVGAPVGGGVTQLNGVGLFNTADTVLMLSQIAWGPNANHIGGYDSLTVHTTIAQNANPAPVPEPGTLSLFAVGAAVMASVVRRRQKQATQV